MSGTFIQLPLSGGASAYWGDPVASFGALPGSGTTGEVRLVTGSGVLYWWDGAAWQAVSMAAGALIGAEQTTATSTGVGATGVYGDVVSIALTAGKWLVSGCAGFKENGAVLTTSMDCAFSDSATGVGLTSVQVARYNHLVTSTSDLVAPIIGRSLTVAALTTYYLNTRMHYTSGSPQHYGRLEARYLGS